jgi:hypothetical protein
MPIDDNAERDRRAARNRDWVKARAGAKAESTPSPRPTSVYQSQTRKQVANRVQSAAGEALAALRRSTRKKPSLIAGSSVSEKKP